MKTLLIVDVQNDFLPGGSLAVPLGDTVIPTINALQKDYGLIVATQDWHPANHLSFASQHAGRKAFEEIELDGIAQTLWPDHCVQGTQGAQLSSLLDSRRVEAIFRKGIHPKRDSYSGFYDNDHDISTGLSGYLRDRGVVEIHVCGLAADYCVYFTAMDALAAGFKTTILSKATKPIDKTTFMDKKQHFLQIGGSIL